MMTTNITEMPKPIHLDNKKGYSLIELLLSISLIAIFLTIGIICANTSSKGFAIETKAENYITLNKYVKYTSALEGKISKIVVIDNKVKAMIENEEGEYDDIYSLQTQVEDINEDAIFESLGTNINTYYPNGSVEKESGVSISMEETNVVLIDIDEWMMNIIYTNKVENFDTDK